MDVHAVDGGYAVQGQVILSMPGSLCLRCFNFLRPELLDREAQDYSKAGGRPQVVWPNGVLASTAVGLFMELVTPWHNDARGVSLMYDYDGNRQTMILSGRVAALASTTCRHFGRENSLGDPFWKPDRAAPGTAARMTLPLVQRLRRLFGR
jgi:hypothetical protein